LNNFYGEIDILKVYDILVFVVSFSIGHAFNYFYNRWFACVPERKISKISSI